MQSLIIYYGQSRGKRLSLEILLLLLLLSRAVTGTHSRTLGHVAKCSGALPWLTEVLHDFYPALAEPSGGTYTWRSGTLHAPETHPSAITPASVTGVRKRDFTTISFFLVCLRKLLSQLPHIANVSLCEQSRTRSTRHILHHETESSKLQTDTNSENLCLSHLSACLHRSQKQNSLCFQCQKAS